jgi:ribosomal protein S18 acetylase RimI-like enzyme
MDSRPVGILGPVCSRRALRTAARILASAFHDDLVWRALLPDDGARRAALEQLWLAVSVYAKRYGEVWTTVDDAGVACFIRPGRAHVTVWRELWTGMRFTRFLLRLGPQARRRFLASMPAIDRLRRRHAYLWAVGVLPEARRRGIGTSLIVAGLARVDAMGVPCYLETETEGGISLYRRFGFEVVGEAKLTGMDVRAWSMVRTSPAPLGGSLRPASG